jgi:hypothetical protein
LIAATLAVSAGPPRRDDREPDVLLEAVVGRQPHEPIADVRLELAGATPQHILHVQRAIPFFLGPHLDTVIECLPTCATPDHLPQFPPITYDAHLAWWYDANYAPARQSDARPSEAEAGR